MKKSKMREFVKTHKKQIACATIGLGVGAVGGFAIYKIRLNSLNKSITANMGAIDAIKNELKSTTTLRPDIAIKDAFMTVEYVDGDIGIIKDIPIEKLMNDGILNVQKVADALEHLTPKKA